METNMKTEILKWLIETVGEVAIEKAIEAGIDLFKLLGDAKTEAELTPAQKYNAYVVGKFCEKEESSLVSEEALSQESVYIDAYIKHGENEPEEKILDRIDQWSQKDKSGVMLIHGEPGHGKTTLCRKAVYEFYRNRFGEKKTNVFWFRLNPAYSDIIKDGELVLENAFCWGNIKSQREMIPLRENKEAYEKSIIFLDGYDELKVQAKSRLSDFIDKVKDYAEEYQIHFVITARTRSVEDELHGLKISTLQFAPMTKKQQMNWIHKRKELQEYEEKFVKLRDSSKEMEEMLGIPILFRMVVREKLESTTAQNVVGLYDTLFEATMKRRKMESGRREDWHKEYEHLAYKIYCNDETFADMQKENMPEEFLYMFHLKGEGKQHVEFLHRSFYQYFLAHFLYRKMSEVKDEESAEAFLCCLAERRIDKDVLNYIQQVQKNKQIENGQKVTRENCKQIIDRLEQTGTVIKRALKVLNKNGNAEKHRLLRCENVCKNTLNICCIVSAVEESRFAVSLYKKENIHASMRRYNCMLAQLNYADLRGANLNRANLVDANLSGANLSGADLVGASLIGAKLIGTNLNREDLIVANLNETNLSNADLSNANLSGDDLSGAKLNGAKLTGIKLIGTKLMGADLIDADLTGANLNEANLTGVDLRGADLTGATLNEAHLNGADLRYARNLKWCYFKNIKSWMGCKVFLSNRDELGLKDPDAHGIIWCDDETGDPIEP